MMEKVCIVVRVLPLIFLIFITRLYQYLSVIFLFPLVSDKPELLPTGNEEREVLGVGSIPVAILP